MSIKTIWCCECGEETQCESKDLDAGAVWQCNKCHKSFGCVRTLRGPKVWVELREKDVEFHRIFDE